jgi:UDP-N-acetylglucosamine--N-acetylmuramyl-(pentapeptide) pyrophosphoryl-undecaprenol N-acetylglucosamine transferase
MRIIVTGGGTGGHLFPGIAVAEAMLQRFPQGRILFVSTDRSIDNRALASRPFARAAISCAPLKGRSLAGKLLGLARLPLSLVQALRVVSSFKPELVLGVGGYVTGPVVLAAKLLGVPTCIHEQNSVPGMANRTLGKIVDRIYISIPGSERFFPLGKTVLTGNPVRAEILSRARETGGEGNTLLVLGGSQGAHRLNELVLAALSPGVRELAGFRIIHQTGAQDRERLTRAYAELGISAQVEAFIDDMAGAYCRADLVVSRAGATTLAELMVMGRPAVFVPYPFAADDHQSSNAAFLVAGGGARMFRERDLDPIRLRKEIFDLLGDRTRLLGMARKMKSHARPEATGAIVAESLRLLSRGDRRDIPPGN